MFGGVVKVAVPAQEQVLQQGQLGVGPPRLTLDLWPLVHPQHALQPRSRRSHHVPLVKRQRRGTPVDTNPFSCYSGLFDMGNISHTMFSCLCLSL